MASAVEKVNIGFVVHFVESIKYMADSLSVYPCICDLVTMCPGLTHYLYLNLVNFSKNIGDF